jgi:flagellar M-ring protein FliF
MDFLNKAFAQLADLFKSMSPGARITAGLLVVLVAVSMTYLFVFQMNTANEFLFGSREFSQAELDAMQTSFGAAGLNQFEVVGKRVRVPRGRLVEYLQALSQSNFQPQNFDSAIDQVVADSNSLIDSRPLQDFKFSQAQEKKCAQVIQGMRGIDKAAVRFNEVKKGGFPPQTERKATVAASGTGGALSPAQVQQIRIFVAGYFAIGSDDVTITDLNANITFGGDRTTRELNGPQTEYAEAKRDYESYWKQKIQECLAVYPGVVVGVNVEVDPELASESRKVVVDPQPTAVESNTYTKKTENRPAPSGRPGAVPNEVASNTPRSITSVSAQESTLDENREQQVSVPGHEQTVRKKAPLIPTSVTATVLIPESYIKQLCSKKKDTSNTGGTPPDPPTPTEIATETESLIESIKKTVLSTLPPPPADSASTTSLVDVRTYVDLPAPEVDPPSFATTAQFWFTDNWQNLGLVGLGLMSLLMLRSMVKSNVPTTATSSVALPAAPKTAADEPVQEEPSPEPVILQRRQRPAGGSLRDELTAMVKEDPDAAANVLRTWIGDAA